MTYDGIFALRGTEVIRLSFSVHIMIWVAAFLCKCGDVVYNNDSLYSTI